MKLRHSNAYAAITVLVIVSMLFIGMYAMMNPFARIFTMFTTEKNSTIYPDQLSCENAKKYWHNGACYETPERAHNLLFEMRRVWLVAPIIFVVGMLIWYFTVALRKDPYYFQQRPPSGGFQ